MARFCLYTVKNIEELGSFVVPKHLHILLESIQSLGTNKNFEEIKLLQNCGQDLLFLFVRQRYFSAQFLATYVHRYINSRLIPTGKNYRLPLALTLPLHTPFASSTYIHLAIQGYRVLFERNWMKFGAIID